MPIPAPHKKEKKSDFISRCMSNSVMKKEFPDNKQRLAVCHSAWKKEIQDNVKEHELSDIEELKSKMKYNEDGKKITNIKHLMSDLVNYGMLEGKRYLVVPTILIAEGVWNNLFYPEEEISKVPQAWNGRPVVVYHPSDEDGNPITANSPEEVEKRTVGALYNTKFEDQVLKSEAWIDPIKANLVDKDVMVMLEKGTFLEVSTGMYTEDEIVDGDWNGDHYDGIVHNIRPDHLAVLPRTTGACSWSDGAGMPRVNESIKTHELSHYELSDKLQLAVNGTRTGDFSTWIIAVFDSNFVYEKDNKLFKQAYGVAANEEIVLNGGPVEVQKEVKYTPVNNDNNIKKNEETMDEKEKMVKALIDNEKSKFAEKDKEDLLKLNEEILKKMVQNQEEAEKEEAKPEVKPEEKTLVADAADKAHANAIPKEEVKPEVKAEVKPLTAEEYIGKAPKELQEVLDSGLKMHRAEKGAMIKALTEDKRCKFTEKQLEDMSLEEIKKLTELAQVEPDFSGQGGGTPKENEAEVPDMPVYNWDKK